MQLQTRILHSAIDGETTERERRPANASNHSLRNITANDEPADHDIVAGEHVAASGDVCQARRRTRVVEIINFDKRDAGRVIRAANDRRVVARTYCCYQCRFTIIRRGETARGDLALLRASPG